MLRFHHTTPTIAHAASRIGAAPRLVAIALAALLIAAAPRLAAAAAAVFDVERVDGDTTFLYGEVSHARAAAGDIHVAYRYDLAEALRYAKRSGGAWTYEFVDAAFFSEGGYASMELDSSGNPHVLYQAQLQHLVYARKSGASWTFEVPAYAEQSGLYAALELDAQGYAHATDLVGGLTYMIRYHRRTAPGWTTEVVEQINEIGTSGTSIALDAQDVPHVTYNGAAGSLRYAERAGGAWTRETIEPAGSGIWSPIAIDSKGDPHVMYTTTNGIFYARRAAGAWTIEGVLSGAYGFGAMSLVLDAQDEPHATYTRGFDGDLFYARREGGAWTEQLVTDSPNHLGYSNSLSLDAAGDPHIVFSDGTDADVLYARASSLTGVAGAPGSNAAAEPSDGRPQLRIAPNPSRGGAITIRFVGADRGPSSGYSWSAAGAATAAIFDASGRLLRSLDPRPGDDAVRWDGRANDGNGASPGVYFARVTWPGRGEASQRFAVLR